MRTAVAVAMAALSAGLYVASFPPLDLTPLAWVALVPLLVAAARAPSVAGAAGLGALWGLLVAALAAGWLPATIVRHLDTSWLAGFAGWAWIALALTALPVAAFAAFVRVLAARGSAGAVSLAAGFGACEWLRANFLGGNPWMLLAQARPPGSRLLQTADFAGPYAAGIVIASVNAAIAGCVAAELRGRWPRTSRACAAAGLIGGLLYGEIRLAQSFGAPERIEVAIVQSGVAPGGRVAAGEGAGDAGKAGALERDLAASAAAAAAGARLVVWPEYAVDFFPQEDSPGTRALLSASGTLGADLVLGAGSYTLGARGPVNHNSAFLLRDGRLAGRYDKVRLLPFAESNPLGLSLSDRPPYEPGGPPSVLRSRIGRLGAVICFEAMDPGYVRGVAGAGAELLVNLSNDEWFGRPFAARLHLEMAALRAIETRRFLVRATPTGYSALVDPQGRLMVVGEFGRAAVVRGAVGLSRERTFYLRHGDLVPRIAAVVAVMVLAGAVGRGKKAIGGSLR